MQASPPRDSAVDHMRKHLLVIVNVLAIFFLSAQPNRWWLTVIRVKCQLVADDPLSHACETSVLFLLLPASGLSFAAWSVQ